MKYILIFFIALSISACTSGSSSSGGAATPTPSNPNPQDPSGPETPEEPGDGSLKITSFLLENDTVIYPDIQTNLSILVSDTDKVGSIHLIKQSTPALDIPITCAIESSTKIICSGMENYASSIGVEQDETSFKIKIVASDSTEVLSSGSVKITSIRKNLEFGPLGLETSGVCNTTIGKGPGRLNYMCILNEDFMTMGGQLSVSWTPKHIENPTSDMFVAFSPEKCGQTNALVDIQPFDNSGSLYNFNISSNDISNTVSADGKVSVLVYKSETPENPDTISEVLMCQDIGKIKSFNNYLDDSLYVPSEIYLDPISGKFNIHISGRFVLSEDGNFFDRYSVDVWDQNQTTILGQVQETNFNLNQFGDFTISIDPPANMQADIDLKVFYGGRTANGKDVSGYPIEIRLKAPITEPE